MNYWLGAVALLGMLSTAVLWGTDMFFLTIGRPALKKATLSAGTEVMGFLHLFADARMPMWGVAALLSNIFLALCTSTEQRWCYAVSALMLLSFVIVYNRLSKPINRLQTEAATTGRTLENGRELQASWNRSLLIRVPLLAVSMLAQCLVFVATTLN